MDITRLGTSLQRVDLPCSSLGLAVPPAAADLKVMRAGTGWTVLLSCEGSNAEAFTRWLYSIGAADVLRGPAREPLVLRGRFHQLPLECQ